MKIEIDLEILKNLNLSPSEYVVLYLIDKGINDFQNELIINSLIKKGYLNENKNLIQNLFNSNSCKHWIDEWLSLWPSFILPGNYRVSGNRNEVINRMNKFIKENPNFNKDIIIKATENYLNRQRNQGWAYTKKNSKFIKDTDGSILEGECLAIIENNESFIQNNVKFI